MYFHEILRIRIASLLQNYPALLTKSRPEVIVERLLEDEPNNQRYGFTLARRQVPVPRNQHQRFKLEILIWVVQN